jgi:hypothetical protein
MENRSTLKSYFEMDDIPTGTQFASLIDSNVNITDDGVLVGGESGILPHSGGGQTNAYQITKRNNELSGASNSGDSVKLPVGIAGMICEIFNNTSNPADVFPSTGGYINNQDQNTAYSISSGLSKTFCCYSANKWFCTS